jgi:predicted Fe-S protein YdhL (DUF1289 family)
MDPRSDTCLGCGRTLGEIAEWGMAQPARQRAIAQDAAARLASLSRR